MVRTHPKAPYSLEDMLNGMAFLLRGPVPLAGGVVTFVVIREGWDEFRCHTWLGVGDEKDEEDDSGMGAPA